MKQRLYKFDNLRFLLMFLVVLGHLLEIYPSPVGMQVYRVIYSFHMPLFIFISGYFAKYDRAKILANLVYPYIIFQFLYLFFSQIILKKPDIVIQFTTPFWILWYLMAIVFCYMLLPMFSGATGKRRIMIIAGLFGLGLLAGYENTIGYYLSLGRFFSFLPFFVLGYFARDGLVWLSGIKPSVQLTDLLKLAGALFIICAIVYVIKSPDLTPAVFYQSMSYKMAKSNVFLKLCSYVIALVWIGSLLVLVPEKRIPLVTSLGLYTLPVYLLHGFIIKAVGNMDLVGSLPSQRIVFSLGLTYLLIFAFSNPYVGKFLNRLFTANWILDFIESIKNRKSLWG
ncbi:MAG: acyltransferase family protein [Erysipelotrichaceae bacterium]|nr:acyltransferase family protein [Erysipelotrichaceae bacterium]